MTADGLASTFHGRAKMALRRRLRQWSCHPQNWVLRLLLVEVVLPSGLTCLLGALAGWLCVRCRPDGGLPSAYPCLEGME